MTRIRQTTEPVPLCAAVLELSAERDTWLARLLDAWRAGWRACERYLGDQYEAGFADGLIALKHAQHDLHSTVELDSRRWTLRGEPRTRTTFSRPHPGDYRGGGVR